MNTHSSGYYSIDKDYNILSYNDTAKQLYPNLQPGVKCYKALMGLDSPCPPCPVALGIQGPKTYLDPIRHIYETVDAVETVQPDGSRGHALVFSTVAEGESLSKSIPTDENSLRLLGAINLLASDYMSVYGVNRETGKISVYRSRFTDAFADLDIKDNSDYKLSFDFLIQKYALPDILSLFHPAYVQYILPGFYRCQWQPYRPGDTDPAYIHSCPDSASLL